MKKFALFSVTIGVLISLLIPLKSAFALDYNNVIDDSVFDNANTMSAGQIDAFLNAFPNSCLSTNNGFSAPDPTGYSPSTKFTYGGLVSAGTVISHVSQAYGINPQVLIATIQKEQGLVVGDGPNIERSGPDGKNCGALAISATLGYNCPDSLTLSDYSGFTLYGYRGTPINSVSQTCVEHAAYVGFSRQVVIAAWQFTFDRHRAEGLNNWYVSKPGWDNSDDLNFCYSQRTVAGGPFYLCPDQAGHSNDPFISHGGQYVIDGTVVTIQNGATAAFYNYTPHKHGQELFTNSFNTWFGSTFGAPLISYKSHLSGIGWTGLTTNSGVSGTTGQNRTMEAFKINGEVEYSSYNFTTGWQPTVNKGMISGTTGMSRPIQAIKINPTGSLAINNDIYYRTHVSNIGWMGWTKNGQPAGISGDAGKNIEAIEIFTLPKGLTAPGPTDNAYQNINIVTYSPSISLGVTSHVGDVGWQPTVTDTMVSGTTEQAKRIEALKIDLNNNSGSSGGITYSAHLAGIGWQGFKSGGEIAGTTGQSRSVEAIRIALTGNLSNNYDIWYRGHVQSIGWLDWAKNGEPAGSVGAGLQLEAFETRVTPKNSISLPQQNKLYNPKNQPVPDSYTLDYSAHVSNIGWINGLKQNSLGGTTGQSKALEAIKINSSSIFGTLGINCSAYVRGPGWMSDITPGNTCGTVGQSKPLESIKLSLTGDAASKYDLYYKVHVSTIGWQDWVKNNAQAGTPGSNKQVEAVIIKLVQK